MAWAREVFHRLPTGLRLAPDRRATWLLTLGGWALDRTHLLPCGLNRLGGLSPLVMQPVERALGCERDVL
jgi:hypothetical protein